MIGKFGEDPRSGKKNDRISTTSYFNSFSCESAAIAETNEEHYPKRGAKALSVHKVQGLIEVEVHGEIIK